MELRALLAEAGSERLSEGPNASIPARRGEGRGSRAQHGMGCEMKALRGGGGTELDSALGTGVRRRPGKLPALYP